MLGDDWRTTDLVRAWRPGFRAYAASMQAACANVGQVEVLTVELVSINRRYKAHAGLRVTDLDR